MRALAIRGSLLGVSAMLLAACSYDNGSDHHYVDSSYQGSNPPIYRAAIDADATMTDIIPGQGVGMMIEYSSGGTWHVKFTCDTSITNLSCLWSIDAQSLDGSSIGGIDVQLLDSGDVVTPGSTNDRLSYDGTTTTELDTFSFQADAGKPIGFDIWLQGEPEPNRYVFWIGDGWLNKGISGPSFDLSPNSP